MGLSSGDVGPSGAGTVFAQVHTAPRSDSSLPASPAATVQWVSQEGGEEGAACVSVCVEVGMASRRRWKQQPREGAAESGGPVAPTGSCLGSSQE